MGDVLVSAACLVYSGVLTAEFRQLVVERWEGLCAEHGIPLSSSFSLVEVMAQKQEVVIGFHSPDLDFMRVCIFGGLGSFPQIILINENTEVCSRP